MEPQGESKDASPFVSCTHISPDSHILDRTMFALSEVAQSCPTLCNPMDCILPGSSVHGIFQATVLEWVAIAF